MPIEKDLFSDLHKHLNRSDKSINMLLEGISKIDTSQMEPDLAESITKMRTQIPGVVNEMKKSGDPMAVYKKIEAQWLSGSQK